MNAMRHTTHFGGQLISPEELQQLLEISNELEAEKPQPQKFNTHHVYMQFLGHTMAHDAHANPTQLSLNEQHLLERIAVRCDTGNPLRVSEACLIRQFGCPSTVHHQIHKLTVAGVIFLDSDPKNRRQKMMRLSDAGRAYFQEIEDCLDMALVNQ